MQKKQITKKKKTKDPNQMHVTAPSSGQNTSKHLYSSEFVYCSMSPSSGKSETCVFSKSNTAVRMQSHDQVEVTQIWFDFALMWHRCNVLTALRVDTEICFFSRSESLSYVVLNMTYPIRGHVTYDNKDSQIRIHVAFSPYACSELWAWSSSASTVFCSFSATY